MRQRKLQVFLSSTYSDLIGERLAAMETILAAGHIPAAMEQFTPGDEKAWEKIKRWIDDSDCYILILGGRYGSIRPNSEKSYTQLEYEYALEQGKPFMSIVMNEGVLEKKVQEGGKLPDLDERENQQLYKEFKELVMKQHVAFWSDPKDIETAIYRKLPDWHSREDLKGWVRAEEAASPEAINELARLSKENDELRQKLSAPVERFDGLSFEEMVNILKRDKSIEGYRVSNGQRKLEDYAKKYLFIPENAGHLFDICVNFLGSGIYDGHLKQKVENTDVGIVYNLHSLSRHGLVEVQREEIGRGSSLRKVVETHKLSETGKRFRNHLLIYGDQETRFRELWGVELVDEKIVEQEG